MEEEMKKINKLIERCEKCDFKQCENCEISWTEVQAIKRVIDDLQKSVEYTMDCYQDAGKKMFEYAEQLEDSVPKSKIRDKVEKLEDKVHVLRPDATKGEMMMEFKTEGAIDILYELLEDK